MKKVYTLFFYVLFFLPTIAQNVQLHYDLGKQEDGTKHNNFIGTFEFFKPDSIGYSFFFTDFEFNSPDNPKGASLGYFEISRNFHLPWSSKNYFQDNLGLHIEYNDGTVIYAVDDSTTFGENLHSTWLGGIEYSFLVGNFSFNAMALYKYTRSSNAPDFQCTIIWFYPLLKNKITLTGYADFWTQDNFNSYANNKMLVFYSEPQIWFNAVNHLSIGSELKISHNFIYGSKRVEVFPTLGVKWEF